MDLAGSAVNSSKSFGGTQANILKEKDRPSWLPDTSLKEESEWLSDAVAHINQNEFDAAVKIYVMLIDQGSNEAMMACREYLKQDKLFAQEMFSICTQKEVHAIPGAMFILGWMYQRGEGVPQDVEKAVEPYQLSADQGNAFAQLHLGSLYYRGKGIPQDVKKAAELYHLAADQGDASAQEGLGYLYQYGEGVQQDFTKAVRYFHLSADQGNANAQNHLGHLFTITKDEVEAARLQATGRIKSNQAGLNKLKMDQGFKNTLMVLRRHCTEDMLSEFFAGTKSLESCMNNASWIVALIKHSPSFQLKQDWFGPDSHYLSADSVKIVSEILHPGIFDGQYKLKLYILLNELLDEDEKLNFQQVDLRGADLRGAKLTAAELVGADLRGAKSDDVDIQHRIEFMENYMLLLQGEISPKSVFNMQRFPRELINEIVITISQLPAPISLESPLTASNSSDNCVIQ